MSGEETESPEGLSLNADALGFSYRRGGDEVISGISHRFAVGEITAITGKSGTGKSTLLYILGLMLRPTRGSVSIGDLVVDRWSDAQRSALRAEHIGFVFQDAHLDDRRTLLASVLEPAIYSGMARAEACLRAKELLAMVGLADRAGHRPTEVSGGQAQRAAIARSLLMDPEIILADEPTGNLDRENALIVLTLLREAAASGRTVVIATHDPFVMDRVDAKLVIS